MKTKRLIATITIMTILSLSILSVFQITTVNANDIPSSTLKFEGVLTDNGDGTYSGVIHTSQDFDVYAKVGSVIDSSASDIDGELVPSNHDAYPLWTPDVPDAADDGDSYGGPYYALNLDETTWELWYVSPEGSFTQAYTPMSGTINWNTMYATETGQNWEETWSWGYENIKLAFEGFDITITDLGGNNYEVTMTPSSSGSPSGPVVNENTSESFGTIQSAIDLASSGDTILVYPGTYEESVIVDVEDLTLKSTTGVENTIIDAGGNDLAIRVQQNLGNVSIEGFTVQNWMVCGIVQPISQTTGTATHVINNTVKVPVSGPSAQGNSIQVSGNHSTVIGNDVEVTGYDHEEPGWATSGILVVCASNTLVKGNYVHYNPTGVSEHYGGIQIASIPSWGATAKDNVIQNNLVEGLEVGIDVQGDTVDTLIVGNTVTDNDVGIGSYSWEGSIPSGTEIHDNNIVNNEIGVESGSFDETDTEKEVNVILNWWGTTEIDEITTMISGDVIFAPWLDSEGGEPADNSVTEGVSTGTGTVDATDEANTEVEYDASGSTTVTVTDLPTVPEGTPSFKGIGKSVDVYVPDPTQLNSITIKVYYEESELGGTDESTLRMYYWDDTTLAWLQCSYTGVNTTDNYIWTILNSTSEPGLDYLLGGPFTPGVPEIILTPDEGLITTITGGGFAPTTGMTIYWSATEVNTIPTTITTDGVGEFTAIFAAITSTPGTYTISATDGISTAYTTFTVPDMKGEKGDKGDTGAKGQKGDMPDISPLLADINNLNSTVLSMIEDIDSLNITVLSIEGNIVTLNTEIGNLWTNLDALDAELVSIDGTVATVKTNLDTLSVSVSDLDVRISSVEEGLPILEGKVVAIDTTLGELTGNVTSIEENIIKIQTDIGTLESDICNLGWTVEDIQSKQVPVEYLWFAILMSIAAVVFSVVAIMKKK